MTLRWIPPWALAATLWSLLAPAQAAAQGRWAVVVAQAGERAPAARRTAEIAAVRLRGHGASVVDVDTARSVVDHAFGQPAAPLSPELARALATTADAVLEDVAFGRNQRALDVADPVLERAGRFLAAIGVDAQARAHLGNLCLFTVRALLQDEREPEAEMRVLECVRGVPDLEPDPRVHPRAVRELLARRREGLTGGPHGILAVRGPADCEVRVNGRPLGRTPTFERAVPPGSYDVQARCPGADAARVRRVDIPRGGRAELVVEPGLESRLDASEGLLLAYDDVASREAHLAPDSTALARVLGVGNLLVVSAQPDRTLALARLRLAGGEVTLAARAELPASPSVAAEQVAEAVTALLEGRELGADASTGGRAADTSGSPVGWLLGGVGLAGLVASWVLYGTWLELAAQVDAYDPVTHSAELDEAIGDRDDRGRIVLVTGAASAAVLTVAVPLALPSVDGVPWWSLVVGAAGAGLAIWGLLHSLDDGDELDRELDSAGSPRNLPIRTVPLGPLVASHGAPLLAVPLTYLVRALTRSDGARATLALRPDAAILHLTL